MLTAWASFTACPSTSPDISPYAPYPLTTEDAPLTVGFEQGNAFNVFSAAISCIIGLTCSLYASWENKQREAGRRDWRLDGKSEQEIKELGEMHPRYKLMS